MFPTAEYYLTGELAYRRERIAADFAQVGRSRRGRPERRRQRPRRAAIRRLRNTIAIGH